MQTEFKQVVDQFQPGLQLTQHKKLHPPNP
jgi:hypothetical protein